jgi:hypothetical protein
MFTALLLAFSCAGFCQFSISDSIYIDGMCRYLNHRRGVHQANSFDTVNLYGLNIGYFTFPDTLLHTRLINSNSFTVNARKRKRSLRAIEIRPIHLQSDTAIFSIIDGYYSYKYSRKLLKRPKVFITGSWDRQFFYYYVIDNATKRWVFVGGSIQQ